MGIFGLKRVTLISDQITPDRIKKAKEFILSEVAKKIGGRVNEDTLVTEKNIQGNIYYNDWCEGEFAKIPTLKKEV